MSGARVELDTDDEGQPRVMVSMPDPAKLRAWIAAVLALWAVLRPIIGMAKGEQPGGDQGGGDQGAGASSPAATRAAASSTPGGDPAGASGALVVGSVPTPGAPAKRPDAPSEPQPPNARGHVKNTTGRI